MPRPISGPLWPPSDDPVENSLRRAYLRAPLPVADDIPRTDILDLLARVTKALEQPREHCRSA